MISHIPQLFKYSAVFWLCSFALVRHLTLAQIFNVVGEKCHMLFKRKMTLECGWQVLDNWIVNCMYN